MKNIHRLIFACLFILMGSFALYIWKTNTQKHSACAQLTCITMNGIQGYRLKEIYSDTSQIYRALFTHDDRLLRIEARRIPKEASIQELDASITRVKAMFENAPAPYPGELSDTIACDQKFVPTYREIHRQQSPLHVFIGYLNNRLTFGSCSQNQAVYKGALIFTYCPEKSVLVRLELMAQTADFERDEEAFMNQITSLACGR